MFMHGGWEHIIFNMLFLWIFGNNVEDAMGKVRFLLWYIAGGLAATLVQTFVTLHFGAAQDASIPNIGASGAIAAVLGAYFVLLPNARVLTAIFFILIFFQELPAVCSSVSGSCSSSGRAGSRSCSRRRAAASRSSRISGASSSGC